MNDIALKTSEIYDKRNQLYKEYLKVDKEFDILIDNLQKECQHPQDHINYAPYLRWCDICGKEWQTS